MKTTYLDNKIILLEGYKKEGTATPYQLGELKEYLKIKQLITATVVEHSEQLFCDEHTPYVRYGWQKGHCLTCAKKLEAN